MKYLISIVLMTAFFSGCETDNGGCCESMAAKTKEFTPTPKVQPVEEKGSDYEVKNPKPIPRPTPTPIAQTPTQKPITTPTTTKAGDPVAVITGPKGQTLEADKRVHFSCDDSYDTDEQGKEIKTCEWTFECHKKDGYTCNCPKKGKPGIDVSVKPHPNADYMIAHLKVTDNEGVTNETSIRYDVISK